MQPFSSSSIPNKRVLWSALSALWIVSISLAVGPLVVATDRPTINQQVLIEKNSYFETEDVSYSSLKNYSMNLLTFHPGLRSASADNLSRIFDEISSARSWNFMQEFLNQWSQQKLNNSSSSPSVAEYEFKSFKG